MPGGVVSHLFLQGQTGTPVYVNENDFIYFTGVGITIYGTAATHTMHFDVIGAGVITYTADFGTATANANLVGLFGSAAQGLFTTASGNTITFSILDWTTAQKGVGRLATPAEVLGGTTTDVALTPGDIQYLLGTLDFIADDHTSAAPAGNEINLLGSAAQGLFTSASGNTVTFSNVDWTTIQKGVGRLATDTEAIDGTVSTAAITPVSLGAKLGAQTQNAVPYSTGPNQAFGWLGLNNGQLLIGALGGAPVPATLTPGSNIVITNAPGAISIAASGTGIGQQAIIFEEDIGNSTPIPSGIFLVFYLLGSAAQGLVTVAGSSSALFSNLDWTTVQKGVGRLATPDEVLGGTVTNAALTPGDIQYLLNTLEFVADDNTSAAPQNNEINLLGSAVQGLVTSASGNTITFSNLDWTTIQKGVGRLATGLEVQGGTITNAAITPGSIFYLLNTLDFFADGGSASPLNGILNLLGSAAQGLVTSASGNTITFANLDWTTIQKGVGRLATGLEVQGGTITNAAITPGSIFYLLNTLDFFADGGSASPLNGILNLLGSAAQGLVTSASGNTITFANLDWTTIQKGVGRLATPEETQGGTVTDAALTPGDIQYLFNTLAFFADDNTSAAPQNNAINLLGSAAQGLVTSASGNTITFSNLDWTTIQKGVGRLATPEETQGGTVTDAALTPGDIQYLFNTLAFFADDNTSAAPQNNAINLLGSAAQGLVTSASGNTITFSNLDWTTIQKGVGRLATPEETQGGTVTDAALTPGGIQYLFNTLEFFADDNTSAAPQNNAINLLGSAAQGLVTSASGNTITFSNLDWTTIQKGVGRLATPEETQGGTVTDAALTPGDIQYLFNTLAFFADDNTSAAPQNNAINLLGSAAQGLVTSASGNTITFSNLDWTTIQKGVGRLATPEETQGGTVTDAALTPGGIQYLFNTLEFFADDNTSAAPQNNAINLLGSAAQGLVTSASGNTITFSNLDWTTIQKGVGRLATPEETQGGTVTDAALTPGDIQYLFNTLAFFADDNTSAAPQNNAINLLGSAAQGLVTSASGNTITFSNLDWTTIQKGVGRLATPEETQGGTVTDAALTPGDIQYLFNTLAFFADDNTSAAPQNNAINLLGSAAQGLVTSASGNTITFSNLDWTTIQKGVGRLATPEETQGGTVTDAALTPGGIQYLFNTLEFFADDNTSAAPQNNMINLLGSVAQGLFTSASGNTITFANLDWTTIQKGVGRLATPEETQGGTVTDAALTPGDIQYLFNTLAFFADDNTSAAPQNNAINLLGSVAQGLFTSASGNTITFANLDWTTIQKGVGRLATPEETQGGTVTDAALTPGDVQYLFNALEFFADDNTSAAPQNNMINLLGSVAQGLFTSASGNTITFANLDWTTIQKGVGRLATPEETQGGTVTDAALTPGDIQYLFNTLAFFADDNTSAAPQNNAINLLGSVAQGLFTSASGNTITFANLDWTTIQKGVGRLATPEETQGGTVTDAALTPGDVQYLFNALEFFADDNTSAAPQNNMINLLGSVAQGLFTSASGNTITFSNLDWTTIQKGVGRLATPEETQGGTVTDAALTPGDVQYLFNALEFFADDNTSAAPQNNMINLLGSVAQGLFTSASGNTITFANLDWTTIQKGVGRLATPEETQGGTVTDAALTPGDIQYLFNTLAFFADDNTSAAPQNNAINLLGSVAQGLFTSASGNTITFANLDWTTIQKGVGRLATPEETQGGTVTDAALTPGDVQYLFNALEFFADDNTSAAPQNNMINLLGSVAQGLFTSASGNTITFANLDWTTIQKGVGRLATPEETQGGTVTDAALTPGDIQYLFNTLAFFADDNTSAAPQNNAINLLGSVAQGLFTSASGNTITFANLDWTTIQKGVGRLATPEETQGGTVTDAALTPGDVQYLFNALEFFADDNTSAAPQNNAINLLGSAAQGLVTTASGNTVTFSNLNWTTVQKGVGRLATGLEVQGGTVTNAAITPSTLFYLFNALDLVADSGSASPLNDIVNLFGSAAQGLVTTASGNTVTFSNLNWTTVQKGVGRLATGLEVQGGTVTNAAITPSTLFYLFNALDFIADSGSASPLNDIVNLFGSAAQGLVTTASGNTVTFSNLNWTTVQKGVGRLATGLEVQGGTVTNAAITPSTLFYLFNALDFIADSGSASPLNDIVNLFGSAAQGLVTTASGNTVTFSNLNWTTVQKGVGRLATGLEVQGGTVTNAAITPSTLFYLFNALDFIADSGSASPLNDIVNLFGSAAQGLVTTASGNTITFSNLNWTTIQTGVGRLATGLEVQGGTVTNAAITPSTLFYLFNALDFIADSGSASPLNDIVNLFGSAAQGLVTTASGNTITFSNLNWTTIQTGVGRLATNAEAIAGTVSTAAIVPSSLSAKLGAQTTYALPVSVGSTQALSWLGPLTSGQLLIGSAGNVPVPAALTAGTGISIVNGPGSITINATGTNLGFVEDGNTTATPSNDILNLFGSAAQGLVTTGSGNTVTFSNLNWTTVQKGVGRLATGLEVQGGTVTNAAITPSTLFYLFNALDFIADGNTTAAPANGLIDLFGSTAQGLVTTASGNTVTFSNLNWTTIQTGVGRLATNAEAIAGTVSTAAIVPSSLSAKLGAQTTYALPVSVGSTQALSWLGPLTSGQLLIGSAGNVPVPAALTAGTGISIVNGPGSITINATGTNLGFVEDGNTTATPSNDILNLFGSAAQGLVTTGSGNTVTFSNLNWTTVQKGVGRLATGLEVQGGTVTNAAITPSTLFYLFNALDFIADGNTTAAPANGLIDLFGSTAQGLVTTASGNTVTFSNLNWTTIQKGVGRLATGLEVQGGTVTNAAITPSTLFYLFNALDFIADGNTTAAPANGLIDLFGSTAQGLVTTASGNTITFSNLNWTTVQKGVGRLATGLEVQGGTVTNAAITPSTLFYLFNALDFIADGNTTAAPANGLIDLFGSAAQGLVTAASGNMVTFSNLNWTTVQIGVGRLATNAEAIAGTVSTAAIVPSSLNAKLGAQTTYALPVSVGSTQALSWLGPLTSGQLLIGSAGNVPVPAALTAGTGISIVNGPGSITINATGTNLGFVEDGNTTATPSNDILNLFGSAAQGLVTTGSGNTVTFSNLNWTTVQKGVGRLATGLEVQGGTVTNAAITPSTLVYLFNALDFVADGGSASPLNDIVNLFGSAAQGLVTTGSGNTVTFSNLNWTTVQIGVGRLATNAEAIAGTVSTAAIVPSSLSAKLGAQTTYALPVSVGSTQALSWLGPLTSGQLLIGSAGNVPVPAALTPGTGISIVNGPGSITINATGTNLSFVEDGNTTATPSNNILNLFGSAAQGLFTSGSGNTVTFSNLNWTTVQKGVGRLATGLEVQGGTVTNAAITPSTLFYLFNALDFIADGNTTATPSNGVINHFGSAAQGLVTTASGNTITFSNLNWTTVQKGVGRLATGLEVQGGTVTNAAITPSTLFYLFNALDFIADGNTTATPSNGVINHFGSAAQGLVTTASGNTITFSNLNWTTVQIGVGRLATNAEAIAGTVSTAAIVPSSLSAKLGAQTTYALPVSVGSTQALSWLGPLTSGQLLIGSAGNVPVPAALTPGTGISIVNGPGSITINATGTNLGFVEDGNTTATPSNNILNLFGSAAQGLVTTGSGNTVTFSNLNWTTVQKGVGRLATGLEVQGGTVTNAAITPNNLFYLFNALDFIADGNTTATPSNGVINHFGSAAQGLVTTASGNTITFSNLNWTTVQIGVGRLATNAEAIAGTVSTAAIVPSSLSAKLGAQTTYALPVSVGSTQALSWLGPLTSGQLLIGSAGNVPVPAALTPGTGISIVNGPGSITINATGTNLGFVEDGNTTATPSNNILNLFGSAAQGLVTTGSGNTVTFSNLNWTTVQKGVGRLATGLEVQGGTVTNAAITPNNLFYLFNALDFIADGNTTAAPANGLIDLFGSAAQGLVTTASGNTVTFSNLNWTTVQIGVGRLATNAEAIAGTVSTTAIVPSSLSAKLGAQTTYALPVSVGSTQALSWLGPLTSGQLLIGSAGNVPVPAALTPGTGISIVNGPGSITINATGTNLGFVEDGNTTATPSNNILNLFGSAAQGLVTTGSGNTVTFSNLNWTTVQKGVGRLATGLEVQGGTVTNAAITPNNLFYLFNALDFIADGNTTAAPANGLIDLFGSAAQGLVTTASGNTVTFSNLNWTTVQIGVGRLATNAEAIAGTVSTAAIVPSSLSAKLGAQTTYALPVSVGSTQALSWLGPLTSGQLLIGSAGNVPVPAALTPGTGISIVNGPGSITINATGTNLGFVEDGNTTATPSNNILNLFGSAAQGLVTTGSGNTVTFSNLNWTTVQKGVGRLATGLEVQGGTVTNAAITPSTLFYLFNALDFIADGNTTATPSNGVINHFGSAAQGLVTTASGNTITFSNLNWTTVQIGVGRLATNAEAIAGTVSTAAIVPSSLSAKLGAQTTYALPVSVGSTQALSWLGPLTSGQLLIGSAGNVPVSAALTPGTGISIVNGPGSITINATGTNLGFVEDGNTTATPSNNILNLFGSAAQGLVTTGSGNTVTFSNLNWTTVQIGVGRLATNAEAIAGTVSTAAIVPSSLSAKLGAQTTYALPVSVGSTQALSWLGPLTSGQLLIGSAGNVPVPAALTPGTGISIVNGPGSITINATGTNLGFVEDGNTTATPSNNILNLFGSAAQGLVTTGSGNTVTFSNLNWTTVQKGVGRLATGLEVQGGTVTNAAITPNTLFYLFNALNFIADGNTTATPANGVINHFGSTAQGLVTTASGNTITFSNLNWTTVQKGVGRLATGLEVQGGTVTNAAITPNTLFYLFNALNFIADGNTTATPANGVINHFGSTAQGLVTTASGNTITFSNLNWTTVQIGVGRLATNAEAIAGTVSTAAIVPSSLSAKLGAQTTYALPVSVGSTQALSWLGPLTSGQLLIGSAGNVPVPAALTPGTGISIVNGPGSITINATGTNLSFVEDGNTTATPSNNILNLFGSAAQGLVTTGSGNTVTFSNLNWTTVQKGVGRLATGLEVQGGTVTNAAITPSTLIYLFNALDFVADSGSASPLNDIINLFGSAAQGLVTTGSGNTVTFSNLNWTTVQKGVGRLATGLEVQGGTVTNAAITPSTLVYLFNALDFVADSGSASPLNDIINLFGSAAQGLVTTGSGNTVTFSNLNWTTVQKGVGRLATGLEVQGGTVTNAAITPSTLVYLFNALDFVADSGSASPLNDIINLFGSAAQGLVTTGSGNTITFSNLNWTTIQIGVGRLATNAEAIAGTVSTAAIVPSSLSAKLGAQTTYALPVSVGSTQALSWLGPLTNGQLLIGSTGNLPVVSTLTPGSGISITNASGSITINANNSNITSSGQTLIVTTSANTADIETQPVLQTDTGFGYWTGSASVTGPFFDASAIGSFTVLCPGTGFINGIPVSWTAPQSIRMATSNLTYYVYMNSGGQISFTTTRTDALFNNNIVLFECLRDSTAPTNQQITTRENHPYNFPAYASNYLHDTAGIVIQNLSNGANITLVAPNKISISGSEVLADHGVSTTIPDSGGQPVTWYQYYTNTSGQWALYSYTSAFTGFWNNSGNPTVISPTTNFGIYTLYVSKDNANTTSPQYFAVMNATIYSSLSAANAAITAGSNSQATSPLFLLEMAQLGYIIFQRTSNPPIVAVIISKSTLKAVSSTAGSNSASLILTDTSAFTNMLSASDTNVQLALNDIDDWMSWIDVTGTTQAMSANRGYVADNAALVTFTLPASALFGINERIAGRGAGGWTLSLTSPSYTVFFGSKSATVFLSSTGTRDCVEMVCTKASTEWTVLSSIGNISYQ